MNNISDSLFCFSLNLRKTSRKRIWFIKKTASFTEMSKVYMIKSVAWQNDSASYIIRQNTNNGKDIVSFLTDYNKNLPDKLK